MPINAHRVTLCPIRPSKLISPLALPILITRDGFTGQTMEVTPMEKTGPLQTAMQLHSSRLTQNGIPFYGDIYVAFAVRFPVSAQGQWFGIESARGTIPRKHWPMVELITHSM